MAELNVKEEILFLLKERKIKEINVVIYEDLDGWSDEVDPNKNKGIYDRYVTNNKFVNKEYLKTRALREGVKLSVKAFNPTDEEAKEILEILDVEVDPHEDFNMEGYILTDDDSIITEKVLHNEEYDDYSQFIIQNIEEEKFSCDNLELNNRGIGFIEKYFFIKNYETINK